MDPEKISFQPYDNLTRLRLARGDKLVKMRLPKGPMLPNGKVIYASPEHVASWKKTYGAVEVVEDSDG